MFRAVLAALPALALLALTASPAQAMRPCGFGFWAIGEQCQRSNGVICERMSYSVAGGGNWNCTRPNGQRIYRGKSAKAHVAGKTTGRAKATAGKASKAKSAGAKSRRR